MSIFYKVLDIPFIYNLAQRVLGGKAFNDAFSNEIKKNLSVVKSDKVLDVGCGTGIYRNCFGEGYVGLDLNSNYIDLCKKKFKGLFIVGDATNMNFENDTFDVVSTIGVIHHLNRQQTIEMFDEMKRVCAKHGTIFIFDGLIPKNKFNIWGYAIAKFDRGKYKMYYLEFKKLIEENFADTYIVNIENRKVYPSEIVLTVIKQK